ncbi:MAG TPA: biotin/lipoyl-containing protein [Burkholderiaceae bacterium]|nr:biotin/lipoyl-containing protein [Burkholderiaceae bacterium]
MSDVQSPISGRVLVLHVKAGDTVRAGDALCTLEAMKMEIPIEAEAGGIVAEWFIDVGVDVVEGEAVARLRVG